MPTERFYRLPKEKAETIRRAAVEEFKRVPPEDASINKIIQNADISRGSFYTYFEDKYDLLKWLIGDFIENYKRFYIVELEKNHGDIWVVFDHVLEFALEWVAQQGLVEIVGNMMKGKAFEEMFQGSPVGNCGREVVHFENVKIFYGLIDRTVCEIEFDEFLDFMGIHMTSLIFALKMYFTKEQDPQTIRDSYHRKMLLLRYGASPRGKNQGTEKK